MGWNTSDLNDQFDEPVWVVMHIISLANPIQRDTDNTLTLYMLIFVGGNINIYLHFVSLVYIDMTQVLKILPQVREGPTYSI